MRGSSNSEGRHPSEDRPRLTKIVLRALTPKKQAFIVASDEGGHCVSLRRALSRCQPDRVSHGSLLGLTDARPERCRAALSVWMAYEVAEIPTQVMAPGAMPRECVGGVSRTLRDNERGRESVRLTPALFYRHPPWSASKFTR